MSKPILKMVEISKPFTLQVDASDLGIGAIVLQEENGKKVPVAYASRKLKQSERSYTVIEKECLALVWAVQKFSRYLYGTPFTVETDHCPLKYLNEAKLKNASEVNLKGKRHRIRLDSNPDLLRDKRPH